MIPVALCMVQRPCVAAPQAASSVVDLGLLSAPAPSDARWDALMVPDGGQPTESNSSLSTANLRPGPLQDADASEYYPNLYKTFGLSIGGAAYQNFNTNLRVDSDVIVGASLDLEDTLGVDDRARVVRVDSFWHWNRRHGVDFSFYNIGRSGERVTDRDINYGNIFIPAGTGVKTKFDTTMVKLAYRYNFVSDYRTVIAASAGLHTVAIDASLETTSGAAVDEDFKAALPMPVVGLHFEYALSRTWKLITSMELLQMDLGSYSGVLNDRRLTIEHNPFKNFGWGLGYNGFSLNARADGNGSLSAKVEYEFQGLMLFLRWYM
jgi:hypothetical protein